MPRRNEALVKRKITKALREVGAWYCFPVAGPYGRAGLPDIMALMNGVFLGIEAKSGKNRPTELQRQQLRKIRSAGGLSMVVNEDNLDDFRNLLMELSVSSTQAVLSYSQGRWPSLTKLFD